MVDGMPLLTVTFASKIIPNKKQYKERESVVLHFITKNLRGPLKAYASITKKPLIWWSKIFLICLVSHFTDFCIIGKLPFKWVMVQLGHLHYVKPRSKMVKGFLFWIYLFKFLWNILRSVSSCILSHVLIRSTLLLFKIVSFWPSKKWKMFLNYLPYILSKNGKASGKIFSAQKLKFYIKDFFIFLCSYLQRSRSLFRTQSKW